MALDTGKVWPAKGLIRRPGEITIRLLPPIAPGLSRDAFMATLEEQIEGAVNGLYEQGRAA